MTGFVIGSVVFLFAQRHAPPFFTPADFVAGLFDSWSVIPFNPRRASSAASLITLASSAPE